MKHLIAFALAAFAFIARAETITYTVAYSESATDWTNHVSLPKFDPANGDLTAATVSVVSTNRTATKVENLNRSTGIGIASAVCVVTTSGGPLTPIALVSTAGTTNTLARYDRVTDYGGASGVTNPDQLIIKTEEQPVSDLAAVTGSGSVGLTITAQTTSAFVGLSAYSFSISSTASATVSITYTFTPTP